MAGVAGATPGSLGVLNTIIAQNAGRDCQQSLSALDRGQNLGGDQSCFGTAPASTGVNPAALAVLARAPHRRLTGKLTARLRTDQLGISSVVRLDLR